MASTHPALVVLALVLAFVAVAYAMGVRIVVEGTREEWLSCLAALALLPVLLVALGITRACVWVLGALDTLAGLGDPGDDPPHGGTT